MALAADAAVEPDVKVRVGTEYQNDGVCRRRRRKIGDRAEIMIGG